MRRHLSAARRGLALGHVVERELERGDAAPQDEAAVAVIGAGVVVGLHLHADGGHRLVPLAGHVKVPLALAVEVLLAQVAVAAFEEGEKEPSLELGGEAG